MGARLDGAKRVRTIIVGIEGVPSDDALRRALEAGAEPVAARARDLVRRRSGQLRDSIGVGTQLSPRQASISPKEGRVEVYAGPGALPQAITEEFGTAHEAPHPYMRPAWDAEQGTSIERIAESLEAEFDARAKG